MSIKKFLEFSLNESRALNKVNEDNQKIKRIEKGDPEVLKMARELVGDGQEPNMYFITTSNDYRFNNLDEEMYDYYFNDPNKAPVKIENEIISHTYGPEDSLKKALDFAEKIQLDENIGPRRVIIEDRKIGLIYESVLTAELKVVWKKEIIDDPRK